MTICLEWLQFEACCMDIKIKTCAALLLGNAHSQASILKRVH